MQKQIDLRGLTCPEPVLRTKKLLDDKTSGASTVEALVDGQVNVNNLERLARSMKLKFAAVDAGDHFKVTIQKNGEAEGASRHSGEAGAGAAAKAGSQASVDHSHATAIAASSSGNDRADSSPSVGTVVFLGKDKFGDGDEDFSRTLTSIYLQTMFEAGHRPRAILLANTGVRLLAKDSASFKVLADFRSAGVDVLACGLCVDFYGLKSEIPVEQVTNMFAICEYMFAADRVIAV